VDLQSASHTFDFDFVNDTPMDPNRIFFLGSCILIEMLITSKWQRGKGKQVQ